MKERIIQCFHAGAKTYEQAADMQRFVAADLANRLPLASPKTVLEMGCGTGVFSQYLIEDYPSASFQLIDIAPAMVDACRQRFSSCPNVSVSCVDIEKINTKSKYDLIVSSMTLHWLQEQLYDMHYLCDLLKPGGKFIFSILGEGSFQEWRKVCQHLQLEDGILLFPSISSLRSHYPQWQFTHRSIPFYFKSAYLFLQSLKQLFYQAAVDMITPMCPSMRH